ncbi:MAG: hypothetical protein K2I96_23120 [Lachnospiraceae bacterium]|nr:hypothetical protein [Lachnospiraceae bacterium]
MDEYEKGILIMETMVTRIISESEVSPEFESAPRVFIKKYHKSGSMQKVALKKL